MPIHVCTCTVHTCMQHDNNTYMCMYMYMHVYTFHIDCTRMICSSPHLQPTSDIFSPLLSLLGREGGAAGLILSQFSLQLVQGGGARGGGGEDGRRQLCQLLESETRIIVHPHDNTHMYIHICSVRNIYSYFIHSVFYTGIYIYIQYFILL